MTYIKFGSVAKCRSAAIGLASAALLSACGGGASNLAAELPTPAAVAAVYAGPIAGFGSVIVNGMRFSSVGAELVDDDSKIIQLQDLAIGMTVRVTGDADDSTQLGTARKLEVVRGTRGAVTAVDLSASTLTVLGQVVRTDVATAFQGLANLAALTVGQVVEVYGGDPGRRQPAGHPGGNQGGTGRRSPGGGGAALECVGHHVPGRQLDGEI
jgi:hypothetical protein